MRFHRFSASKIALFVSIFLLFFLASYVRIDGDFGWHLKTGEYILSHGVPHQDIFTYTAANHQWIDHEWLQDVLVFTIYSLGGYGLLSVFFGLLWTASLLISSRRYNLYILALACLAIVPYAGIRPMVWSVLFVSILERFLEKKQFINHIPLLFLVWANLHGGFIIGFLFLFLGILRHRSKQLTLITFLAFLATCINPYGYYLYAEIMQTVSDPFLHFYVSEWVPFSFAAFSLLYIEMILAVGITIRKKGILQLSILNSGILLFLSFMSTRNTPFFVVSSLRYFEEDIEKLQKNISPHLSKTKKLFWNFLRILAVGIIVYGFIHFPFIQKNRESEYPKNTVSYLLKHSCPGNIFNSYDYGGYLIWKLPTQKIYIDGRMPSWKNKDETYLLNYINVLQDENFQKNEFKKYNIQCAILKNDETGETKKFGDRLKNEGWKEYILDTDSRLFIEYL